jgi:membrane protease YdiL (CAAX protease family)
MAALGALVDNSGMTRRLALAFALFLCGSALAAPTVDLHDAQATFEAFKTTQHEAYAAADARYREAIAQAPDDARLAVARCQFLENFQYSEDIDWSDSAEDDVDKCRNELSQRLPKAPEAIVYGIESSENEDAVSEAEKVWSAATSWPKELRARIAARLYALHSNGDDAQAGPYAVLATQLGSPDLVAEAIDYLAGEGKRQQATELAARSALATNEWMAEKRIKRLGAMHAAGAARREMERSLRHGLEISPALQVRTYLADKDAKDASRAAAKLGSVKDDDAARFELALAEGKLAAARGLVRFGDDFETWISRYSMVLAKSPLSAFSPTLLPFTIVVLMCLLATALLPGVLLVPVHYRGLARRVRDRAPMPLFERIGLRHAWIAGAIILIIPALALMILRPDAIGAVFTGASETASTQFDVVAMGSMLSLLALLPWMRRLRIPQVPGQGARFLRVAGVVVACWLAIFAIGALSALVHHALIGGDSSTLQTRMVEKLVRNSWDEYGLFATWLMIAVLTPIVEELVFRGMLLGGMSRHISFGWANALQGLLFACVHGDPPRFLVYLALGLFGGWLTRRYRSLLPAIALHALNTTVAVLSHN